MQKKGYFEKRVFDKAKIVSEFKFRGIYDKREFGHFKSFPVKNVTVTKQNFLTVGMLFLLVTIKSEIMTWMSPFLYGYYQVD